MPTTYHVLGPDNQAYGPVPIEMIQQWIGEGRLTADTQGMRSDMNQWAFVVGMVLYAIDGLLFILSGEWLVVGFHVLALYFIFKGFQACRFYHGATRGHA